MTDNDTNIIDSKERLINFYTSFINAFDGTDNAYTNAEPILNQIFDPSSFVILTDDGPKDLEWYISFAKSFAESGNFARVTSIQATDDGIQVTIENTVDGVAIDPIVFDGTSVVDENGEYKLTYFAPVVTTNDSSNHHMQNVGKMVRLVDECTDKEAIMFICRMKLVDDKVEEFKQHARQGMKDIESTECDTLSFNILYDDPTTCHTVELYRNSRAAIKHVLNMQNNAHRNECITKFAKVDVVEVHGQASKSLMALLSEEDYEVVHHTKQFRRALSHI